MGNDIEITHIVEDDIMICKFPYHDQFNKYMKEAIPYPERRWDPERMRWKIHIDYMEILDDLLEQYFKRNQVSWTEV